MRFSTFMSLFKMVHHLVSHYGNVKVYITLQNRLFCTIDGRYKRRFQTCKGRISAGIYFFQALEFRLPERWPSGSGDWELWPQRSKTLWSVHCFLVVRTLFFGLVYLCCWVILRFLDSRRVAEERKRSSGMYFPAFGKYFLASDFPVSSREAATKLMIDGRKYYLLDPVVQRKDDLTNGEAVVIRLIILSGYYHPVHDGRMPNHWQILVAKP